MDRRRFLLGAAPTVLAAGAGAVAVAGPAGSSPPRPYTKARRGVGLGVQQVLWSAPEGLAALTFDDGPYPAVTPTVLDVLGRYGITGTFMCCGAFAEAEPRLVQQILDRGHHIGNHTWTHRDMSTLEEADARAEIHRTHELLSRFSDIRFYRPPRGQLSGVSMQAAAELGYDILLWSTEELEPIVSGTVAVWHDGLGRGGFLAEGDPERVQRHERRVSQIAQLPAAIEAALDAGVRFVPAASLLDSAP
jgi:peptidoglycan/xylan/chitin deacetylase (PgdA/CDA1 family)